MDWFMVGLALQKRHISVYVNAVENGAYVAEAHRHRLGKAKVGKASIGFAHLADIDVKALTDVLNVARRQLVQRGARRG